MLIIKLINNLFSSLKQVNWQYNIMASKQGYGADLRKFMDLRVDLRLNADRRIAGIMKGYD